MGEFDELDAMKKIAAALEPLDDAARGRALQWALSRFRNSKGIVPLEQSTSSSRDHGGSDELSVPNEHESFAELFEATTPITERDKALVAAYWTQVCEGVSSFPAQTLNALLKDLGH